MNDGFFNLYAHDLVRVAVATPAVRVADPDFNVGQTLDLFVRRFFGTTEFNRSCIPDAPKVGSGGSLSPRGDYRAPSDGEPAAWIAALGRIPNADA